MNKRTVIHAWIVFAVAMPAIISFRFPEDRRGWPMGIWTTWSLIGSMIVFNLSPAMIGNFSWRSVGSRLAPW